MRHRNKFLAVLFVGITLSAWSCKKDKNEPTPAKNGEQQQGNNDQQEQITTVRLTFTNQNDLNDVVTVNWKDTDGSGGNAPTIDNLKLKAGVIYNLKTEFLDEVNNKDVTQEIKAEAGDHQVFYTIIPNANFVTIAVTDKDPGNKDLGLEGTVTVQGAAGDNGLVRVTLKHQPGSKDANINTGATDAEAEFPVDIVAP